MFELKEPAIADPKPPVEQGLAYTIFLRELLRSPAGPDWYKIFGYSGGMPNQLKLNCVAMMGSQARVPKFEDNIVNIDGDEIHLHHMFYEDVNGGIAITNTSLG